MKQIPKLGFGTYGRTGAEGVAALNRALETGYRHFDTAQSYGTESEVGEAVRGAALARDDLWITTKIDPANFGSGQLIPSLERSLASLGTTVDLTLIHWPSPNGELPLQVYLEQLAEAKAAGLTEEIGVSNFPIAMLKEAVSLVGEGQILTNQFELNPMFQNRKLADFCQYTGVLVTCYQPIAKGRLTADRTVGAIADAHGATVAQVALAWEMAKGYVAIPTSGRADHIVSNFAALDLNLTDHDMADLDGLAQARRSIDPDWGPDWD